MALRDRARSRLPKRARSVCRLRTRWPIRLAGHDLSVGLGERLRRLDQWVTGRRFVTLFFGVNVFLASILVLLWLKPPTWLGIALALVFVVICIVGGLGMFAWMVRRAWIGWRDRY